MAFKLTNEQMKMLIEKQTAPPSTGDLMLWGTVDRKTDAASRKRRKVNEEGGLRDRYHEALAAGKTRKAARIKRRMDRKLRKAADKEKKVDRIKSRPDYWMRRGEN